MAGATASVPASPQPTNPFANLFASQIQPAAKRTPRVALPIPRHLAAPPSDRRPTVVCGLTVVPLDPQFDAAMRHVVPETGPKFTVRLTPPTVCKQ